MNWAGNVRYRAARRHAPRSVEEVQEIVRSTERVRAIGSRHSFSDVADTSGDLLSLEEMPRVVDVDADSRTVRIDGAIRYGELGPVLEAAGLALHNLASLPHISVAGACATATHGSGDRLGNLATAVAALEIVTSDGELASLTRDHDRGSFPGAVVAVGGLGVVTRLTLDLLPTYRMRQHVYADLPFGAVVEHFDEITQAADSVSLFTRWAGPTVDQLWLKRRVVQDEPEDVPGTLYGGVLATAQQHPIRGFPPDACTPQLGAAGPWHERLPHFRLDHTPSAGNELQSEYLVPRERAGAALEAIHGLGECVAPLVLVSEVRTVAADDLWLSTAFGRPSVGIHFTWMPTWDGVRRVLPLVEAALAPFEPRPHWGKLFTMPADEVGARYPRLPQFQDLRRRYDPNGKFSNPFLDRYLPYA
jgi:xylitol oxidase